MRIVIRRNNVIFPILPYCISSLQCTNKYNIFWHQHFDSVCFKNHILKAVPPGTSDHNIFLFLFFWHPSEGLVNSTQSPKKHGKSLKLRATYFPWSVHPGFTSKLLSNYSRHLHSTSSWTGAHPLIKHQNWSFHINICTVWLHGPRVPWSRSQNRVCCLPRQLFWALQTPETWLDIMMSRNAV